MHGQHYIARGCLDDQHIERTAHLREIDSRIRLRHQAPRAGSILFDLETLIRALTGSSAEDFDGV